MFLHCSFIAFFLCESSYLDEMLNVAKELLFLMKLDFGRMICDTICS